METQSSWTRGWQWLARHRGVGVLGLAAVLLAAAANRSPGAVPAAPTWEHKALVFEVNGANTRTLEDGKPISLTPRDRIPILGQEGWELVTMTHLVGQTRTSTSATGEVTTTTTQITYYYWLKRPKP